MISHKILRRVFFLVAVVFIAVIYWPKYPSPGWDPDFYIAKVRSSRDGTLQKIYYYRSTAKEAEPLVVSLHTWSGNYRQSDRDIALSAKKRGWNYIHPDARGPNITVKACCSDFVISDIDEAIDWALKNFNVDESRIYMIGASGGGYETLCMFMKSRHKIKTFAAWCPIADLVAWYEESRVRKETYAGDIIRCTDSKNGCLEVEKAKERSPLYWRTPVEKLKFSKLKIYAGIRDGHTGPVPFTHSARFYNKVLKDLDIKDESQYASENDLIYMDKNGSFPVLKHEKIGDRAIFYRKQQGNVELTIFDGGHESLAEYALDLL